MLLSVLEFGNFKIPESPNGFIEVPYSTSSKKNSKFEIILEILASSCLEVYFHELLFKIVGRLRERYSTNSSGHQSDFMKAKLGRFLKKYKKFTNRLKPKHCHV